jgi:uncharacterized protein (TIGR02266 family)
MVSSSGKRSILLVDDVELFLELERTFFHRDDFDLLMAINAEEIMQLVLAQKPDLIFMDMDISGSRGDDICRWIKQDKDLNLVPVIMVVDSGNLEAEALCRQAGCDAIIHRPVKRSQLLSAAKTFLDLADRQKDRIASRLLVEFGQHSDELNCNYSVNISPGGVFVATSDVMPVDTQLAIRVEFPDSRRNLSCEGRVAWLNYPETRKKPHLPTGMGIEFASLADEQLDLLKVYLMDAA